MLRETDRWVVEMYWHGRGQGIFQGWGSHVRFAGGGGDFSRMVLGEWDPKDRAMGGFFGVVLLLNHSKGGGVGSQAPGHVECGGRGMEENGDEYGEDENGVEMSSSCLHVENDRG
eukprot:759513-Hanusia_phi.AAC.5